MCGAAGARGRCDLFGYRRSVLQELRSRYDEVVPRLDSVQHFHVVADVVANLYQFLLGDPPFAYVFGDKRKILSIDARDIQEGNRRTFMLTPLHLRAYLL